MAKYWVYNPHRGGLKVPPAVQEQTRRRILAHAEKQYAGCYNRIDVRFRGALCYIDAYVEFDVPEPFDAELYGESREQYIERRRNSPIHLCRLRYFGNPDRWSMAFFTYSHERYEPCVFDTGGDKGTPEEALDTSAVYLT